MGKRGKATVYDVITQRLVEAIEAAKSQGEDMPWIKPWRTYGRPRSIHGRPYTSINAVLLSLSPHKDPRFVTRRQLGQLTDEEGNRAHVKKGAKGYMVVGWFESRAQNDQLDDSVSEEKGEPLKGRLRARYYYVFNVEDTTAQVPELPQREVGPVNERIEALVDATGVPVTHEAALNMAKAYYQPSKDAIVMPPPILFEEREAYYEVLLHELGHATGHESRLNRDQTGVFGSEKYAYEELVAELTSTFMAAEMGIDRGISHRGAYIDSWLSAMKGDSQYVFKASREAQRASAWLLEHDLERSRDLQPQLDTHPSLPAWEEASIANRIADAGVGGLVGESLDMVVISRSAKEQGMWQGTFFDQSGPGEDIRRPTVEALLEELKPKYPKLVLGQELHAQVESRMRPSSPGHVVKARIMAHGLEAEIKNLIEDQPTWLTTRPHHRADGLLVVDLDAPEGPQKTARRLSRSFQDLSVTVAWQRSDGSLGLARYERGLLEDQLVLGPVAPDKESIRMAYLDSEPNDVYTVHVVDQVTNAGGHPVETKRFVGVAKNVEGTTDLGRQATLERGFLNSGYRVERFGRPLWTEVHQPGLDLFEVTDVGEATHQDIDLGSYVDRLVLDHDVRLAVISKRPLGEIENWESVKHTVDHRGRSLADLAEQWGHKEAAEVLRGPNRLAHLKEPRNQERSKGFALTVRAVRRQLEGMGADHFDVSIRHEPTQQTTLERELTVEEIVDRVPELRKRNRNLCHIDVRPSGLSRLTFLDDLKADQIDDLVEMRARPAVIVESSPGNYQVWLKHSRELTADEAKLSADIWTTQAQGDPGAAAASHFGKLAGFTNPKQRHMQSSGYQPFVLVHKWSGEVFEYAEEFDRRLEAKVRDFAAFDRAVEKTMGRRTDAGNKTIDDFRSNPKYDGDHHREDFAYAIYAASHGRNQDDVVQELLGSRDLSKKGNPARQHKWVEATVTKAYDKVAAGEVKRSPVQSVDPLDIMADLYQVKDKAALATPSKISNGQLLAERERWTPMPDMGAGPQPGCDGENSLSPARVEWTRAERLGKVTQAEISAALQADLKTLVEARGVKLHRVQKGGQNLYIGKRRTHTVMVAQDPETKIWRFELRRDNYVVEGNAIDFIKREDKAPFSVAVKELAGTRNMAEHGQKKTMELQLEPKTPSLSMS